MDVLLDSDERQVQDETRAFLAEFCPPVLARRHEHEGGFARELWAKALELGWLDLSLPEAAGGMGLPLSFSCLVVEEAGRAIAPLPLISTLVPALLIAEFGSPTQIEALSSLRSGERLYAFGLQDEDGAWNAGARGLTGRYEGDQLVLNGTRSFVDNFEHASHVLVSFEGDGEQGLALVETKTAGLSATNLVPMSKDSQAVITFTDLRLPKEAVLSGGADAVDRAKMLAALFAACYMAGAARKATELTVAYVSERNAFGQPIGAFQAIQHQAADMIIGVDGVELLAREAAWLFSQGLPAATQVSQAKSFANDKCVFAARSSQQLHGGIGFIIEFDIQLYYRRIVAHAMCFGTSHEHRARVAQTLFSQQGKIRNDWTPRPEPAGVLIPSAERLGLIF